MVEPRRALLELDDARVVRDGREILHVDSLTLYEGDNVALLGPNGAGKSTLIKLLSRDILPLWAEKPPVRFFGQERWVLQEAREFLGLVSDAMREAHDCPLPVRNAVLGGFFGSVGLPVRVTPSAEQVAKAEDLMRTLGIEVLADRTMDTLSTGEARRALIARALVRDPAVLVLDEPCAGLDPHAAFHMRSAMRQLAAGEHTLVLVTHHIEDIVPEISRVVMLRDGRVHADGPKEEMLTGERLGELFAIPAEIEERDGNYRLW